MLLRTLIAGSVLFLVITFALFEYTIFAPAQSPFDPPADQTARYVLKNEYSGSTFFDGFNFEDAPDPTHGHVQYISRSLAQRHNLTYLGDDGLVYIHSDSTSMAPNGRMSVRISSKRQYTKGLFVLDLHHMPEACGAWPAFWTTAPTSWPVKGEIDILEGVNLETDNAHTLHTSRGCSVAQYRVQKGTSESMDCDVKAANQWPNQGCGVKTADSFGSKFNEDGGAVVVMEWTSSVIRMWTFKRDSIPFDLAVDAPHPDIDIAKWGLPDAVFESTQCDIDGIFRDHVIIINTTFCGDWAGTVYAASTCPGSNCVSFVSSHPEAFEQAYWAIKSLKVYQMT
ncbi:Probable glycosidase C21B10.07 [Taphrina deformans PYCC 5710]|uniref:Probable glycosidase C21B10.07 n=1 Tax=Taphrina deformans (strain PYCC 5710 / ATCC 11124 / CBS 356.35 / IMI 108563 / JCM 9778 / NBRC 8474) TaxID=1097556 RepID=S0BE34_TAPDE|nr:Probable glycosidase C21B10.07 [Taphrina deformans PYCC 5710]|eukprot:CCG81318.1 Probable glycosidase C21B10.07 [Taphrina deformans PYCC 5710]